MSLLEVSWEYASKWISPLSALLIVIVTLIAMKSAYFKKFGPAVARRKVSLQLSTILIAFTGVLIVIALIPIDEGNKQQLVTVFGIVITGVIGISSATFVGNAMAGLMLRMVGSYKPGDFIKVGEQFGRVTIIGLLYTEIQTPQRDLTTIPSMFLVTNPVTVTRDSGTMVSCDISLGYDVPRVKIHDALIKAAEKIGLKDAYMLVTNLGDYSVSYRISGLLEEVKVLVSIRSRLREAVLDELHHAGVEIVSPTFMNQRVHSTEAKFVPPKYREGRRTTTSTNIKEIMDDMPDAKIFDKAEGAGGKIELVKALERVEAKLDELKHDHSSKETDAHAERRLRRIEAHESHRDKLREKIDELEDALNNAD